MNLKPIVLNIYLLTSLLLVAPWLSAEEKHEHHDEEHRQHDAHVHGSATMNLILEGNEVHIELDSPAANIVGFEHAPSSVADHAALDKAADMLKKGDRLFKFDKDAGCRMEKADVESELFEEKHAEHEKHSKEEHEHEGETHSDIEAVYHFECDKPGKLTRLTVELFEAFPGTEDLKVQYIINSKQGTAKLTATNHVVKF